MAAEATADTGATIAEMRDAFSGGNWDRVIECYENLRELKGQRAVKVEAASLAVRAFVAMKQRPIARKLMEDVAGRDYAKAIHYEFLALAYLALKQYKDAAVVCTRAEQLRISEQNTKTG